MEQTVLYELVSACVDGLNEEISCGNDEVRLQSGSPDETVWGADAVAVRCGGDQTQEDNVQP